MIQLHLHPQKKINNEKKMQKTSQCSALSSTVLELFALPHIIDKNISEHHELTHERFIKLRFLKQQIFLSAETLFKNFIV
jgi:hypothetical protein